MVRSTSIEFRRALRICLFAVLGIAAACPGASAEEGERVVVGLVPSSDTEITTALADGIRLAFEEARGGPAVDLVVGRGAGRWSTAASTAVDLVFGRGAIALVAPPERRTAHLLAQVGTRSHVPVISTSRAASVTQAGSTWVYAVVARPGEEDGPADRPVAPPFDVAVLGPAARAFVTAFRERYARDPVAWSAVGYDAGRVLVEALSSGGRGRQEVNERLASGMVVGGATGTIRFDDRGNRVPPAAEAVGAEPAARSADVPPGRSEAGQDR